MKPLLFAPLLVVPSAHALVLHEGSNTHFSFNSELHGAINGKSERIGDGMQTANASEWQVGMAASHATHNALILMSEAQFKWHSDDFDTQKLYAGVQYLGSTVLYGTQQGALHPVAQLFDRLVTPEASINAGYLNQVGDEASTQLAYRHQTQYDHLHIEHQASFRFDDGEQGIALSSKWQLKRLDFALGYSQDRADIEGQAVSASRQGIMAARFTVDDIVQVSGLVNYLDGQDADLLGHDLQVQFFIDNTQFSMNYGTTTLNTEHHIGKKTTYVSEVAHSFKPSLQGYISYTLDVSDEHIRQDLKLGDEVQLGFKYWI